MSTQKEKILLLAGGVSQEHEISLSSAKSVREVLEESNIPFDFMIIAKDGLWLSKENSLQNILTEVKTGEQMPLMDFREYKTVFPLLHGPMGEDGTIQGMLDFLNVPYVGNKVLSSAVCMDKVMTRTILGFYEIPQVGWQMLQKEDLKDFDGKKLPYPVFVKPANMGSSVGISKVNNFQELKNAIDLAFSFDNKIIIEESAGRKPRELEIGVLGNDKILLSEIGELTFSSEFYDYETKYTQGTTTMCIPAEISQDIKKYIMEMAEAIYKILDCRGLARIDFFYDEENDNIYFNEVNTMPGFTKTSMYPNLFKAIGIEYPELLKHIIDLSMN